KRRLLGHCFFRIGDYQEAATTWLALPKKLSFDLLAVGAAFLNAEEWEQARQYLNESLRLQEDSYALYLLALAHMQNRFSFDLDKGELLEVICILQKARSLPKCPAEAFLSLERILRFAHRNAKDDEVSSEESNRTQILQEA